jgi:uracil-DNA glycosylase
VTPRVISGPTTAKILILGEAPGEQEAKTGLPFVGASGMELTRILQEAGLNRDHVRLANTINVRPPKAPWTKVPNDIKAFFPPNKKLAQSVGAQLIGDRYCTSEVRDGLEALGTTLSEMPNLELIIPLGNTALWALTGETGITKWRGSQIVDLSGAPYKLPVSPRVVPTIHPAAIMRQWDQRWLAVNDIKRALQWQRKNYAVPTFDFIIRPSYSAVMAFLEGCEHALVGLEGDVRLPLAVDLETRLGHIACVGIAVSTSRAMCIPLLVGSGSFWSLIEETEIMWRVLRLLTHPKTFVIGQNFLYDRQYLARRYGFDVRCHADTMVLQHVCFPGIPKGLDFISSLYNEYHLYWKDESKDWDASVGEAQLWVYNCKDAVATFEAYLRLVEFIKQFGFTQLVVDQMENCEDAFRTMLRGVRVDHGYRKKLSTCDDLGGDTGLIATQMKEILGLLKEFLGVAIEPSSSKQIHWLCYEIFKLPPIKKPGGALTADKDAIAEWLRSCEPLYRPILQMIADYRSLQVFRSTFARAPLDTDGRFRCSINVAGPETFRYSTGSDAFGFGTNMQNIPAGDD